MKLLVLADIDDFHWKHGAGAADVVLSCGDIADQVVLEAAKEHECATIYAVKGNHDSNTPFPNPIVDLHLNIREHEGLKFGGLRGSWRYKPRGYFLYEQEEVQGVLRPFPAVDVFLSHNAPRGVHDREDGVHYGFEGLTAYIEANGPKLVIHGHQHVTRQTQIKQTRVIGVYGHALIEI